VRSICPYCGVGCQVDLKVRGNDVVRVSSPWIEEESPNEGSLCVKGRFGTDFVLHRDRLTTPLIRRGWRRDPAGTWTFDATRDGAAEFPNRGGPWESIRGEGGNASHRPRTNPLRKHHRPENPLGDPRDRVATPASWYEPFREATWEEALELTAQQLARVRDTHGPTRWRPSRARSAPTRRTTSCRSCSGPASARTTWTTARGCAIRRR